MVWTIQYSFLCSYRCILPITYLPFWTDVWCPVMSAWYCCVQMITHHLVGVNCLDEIVCKKHCILHTIPIVIWYIRCGFCMTCMTSFKESKMIRMWSRVRIHNDVLYPTWWIWFISKRWENVIEVVYVLVKKIENLIPKNLLKSLG
jgi:hypothetical protein